MTRRMMSALDCCLHVELALKRAGAVASRLLAAAANPIAARCS
jgi:hypothetical protein